MIQYQLNELPDGSKQLLGIQEDGKILYIPMDEANSDYQAYLASLDEQQAALAEKPTAKK